MEAEGEVTALQIRHQMTDFSNMTFTCIIDGAPGGGVYACMHRRMTAEKTNGKHSFLFSQSQRDLGILQ